MKILVMWVIVNSHVGGPEIAPNEYGQMPTSFTVPGIALYRRTEQWHVKVFDSEKEADKFIADAPPEAERIFKADLIEVKKEAGEKE